MLFNFCEFLKGLSLNPRQNVRICMTWNYWQYCSYILWGLCTSKISWCLAPSGCDCKNIFRENTSLLLNFVWSGSGIIFGLFETNLFFFYISYIFHITFLKNCKCKVLIFGYLKIGGLKLFKCKFNKKWQINSTREGSFVGSFSVTVSSHKKMLAVIC